MKESSVLVSLVLLSPMLLLGAIFWFSVRTRRGMLFGVSVPLPFADSPEANRIVTDYRARLLLLIAAAAGSQYPSVIHSAPWLAVATTPLAILGSIALWQLARRQVKPHEIAAPLERKADLGNNSGANPAWFVAIALAVVPLAFTWFYLRSHWNDIPVRFPTHWNPEGIANNWSMRTMTGVGLPLMLGAAVILFQLFVAVFFRLTPMIDRPRATRVMFPLLAAVAWLLSASFCWTALLPLRSTFHSSNRNLVPVVYLIVMVGVIGYMTLNLIRAQGREAYDGTPNAGWRAGGLIYYNPSDAAVMVPKRLGWGWTLNFGRAAAWWYAGIVLVLTAAVSIAPTLLK